MQSELFEKTIEGVSSFAQGKIDKMMEQLNENFDYYITWNCEELYKYTLKVKEYNRWLKESSELVDTAFYRWAKKTLDRYDDFLSSESNVRSTSTNEISNTCSTWKYQTMLSLKSELRGFSGLFYVEE